MTERIYDNEYGRLVLMAKGTSLVCCNWCSDDCKKKLEKIRGKYNSEETEEEEFILTKAIKQLDEYFSGKRKNFDFSLYFEGTEFQKKVWNQLSLIPYGETISYLELAKRIAYERAVRAVAGTCGANPIAIIIPCHRVVGSDGKLGGYTGGIEKKQLLLKHETGKKKNQIKFIKN